MRDSRPLLPPTRPVPLVMKPRSTFPKGAMPKLKSAAEMSAVSQKRFGVPVLNSHDESDKGTSIKMIWKLFAKMDPKGVLADNVAVLSVAGDARGRPTVDSLDLTQWEKDTIEAMAVCDVEGCTTPDDVANTTGVIFSMWQLVESAYAMGRFERYELENTRRVRKAIVQEEEEGVNDDDDDAAEEEEEEEVEGAEEEEEEEEDTDAAEEEEEEEEEDSDDDFDEDDFDEED